MRDGRRHLDDADVIHVTSSLSVPMTIPNYGMDPRLARIVLEVLT